MTIQLALLALCIIQITSYDFWGVEYSAFTSVNLVDNEGFIPIYLGWLVQGNNGVMNSVCDGVSLFGGYNVFGHGASVSKIIPLAPHYKLRVSVYFWKYIQQLEKRIDSWDNEIVYFILDDFLQTGTWYWNTGVSRCGNPEYVSDYREVDTRYSFVFAHNQPTLAVIITTNLDETPYWVYFQYYKESWGFRDFLVEVLYCSPGCLMCSDGTADECWYYAEVEENWLGNFNFDGWTLDYQSLSDQSQCVNIQLFGGIGSFTGSKQLSKQFTSLDPHYKVILQVQFWKFDNWFSNKFYIQIDGQSSAEAVFNYNDVAQLCGNSGGEALLNIHLVKSHTSTSMQIIMKSDLSTTDGSWGLRAFRLFIVKCHQTCLACSGPNTNECSICKTGYILHNSECVDVKWIFVLQQYFQPSDFQIQTGWTITNVFNNQSPFQTCSNQNLVGGFYLLSQSASITLTQDLPRHTKIRVKLEFWKFDTWDAEWFKVFANGILVYKAQFGLNGVDILCGSFSTSAYSKSLDFEFPHTQSSMNLELTTNLNEPPDNESWGIRAFQLFYGVQKDCSDSVIDSNSLPSFIGISFIQSTLYSFDQTLQNKIEITELGLSLQSSFDQTLSVDSAIKKLTILITWNCFLNDQTFQISILQSSYPDYITGKVVCKQKQSNLLKATLKLERTIVQQSEIRLVATSTTFKIVQKVDLQEITQYEMIVN